MASYEPVTALLRGLVVLEAMAGKPPSTIRSLHASTGIPKPTLVRILETLGHAGFVAVSDSHYRLTSRLLALSAGVDRFSRLREVAEPVMTRLQRQLAWPAELAVFDRDAMVVVLSTRAGSRLGGNVVAGQRIPAGTSAIGRAYLAAVPEAERLELVDRIASVDRIDPVRLHAEVGVIAARGYALGKVEPEPGIRALAVPVRSGGDPVAGLALQVARDAMSMAEVEHHYRSDLFEAATEISALLDT